MKDQDLLRVLLIAKSTIEAGGHARDFGICEAARRAARELEYVTALKGKPFKWVHSDMLDSMAYLFETWPEFSGDTVYPVPCDGDEPDDAFESNADLWVGDYGAARMRLLNFMIDTLQARCGG